ncbi:hypothetical protein AN958_09742 [Leucoagaricus sp. SymC.cos]|nr:hypothetical protein AN958_09742 [Leucoagaricus sp. SymC.cos]
MNLKKVFRVDFWKRVCFSKYDLEGLAWTDWFILKRKDKPSSTGQPRNQDQSPAPPSPTTRSQAIDDNASRETTADQNELPNITVDGTAIVQPNNGGVNPSMAAATPEPTRPTTLAQASATSLNIPSWRSGTPAVLEPASASTPNLVVPSNVSQHVSQSITPDHTVNSKQAPDETTVYLNSPAIVVTQESAQSTLSSTSPPSDPSSQWPAGTTVQAREILDDKSWIQIVAPHGSSVGVGAFSQARNFSFSNPTFNDYSYNAPDNFMEKFEERTIRGAAVDSSARDPPPRCHPGTRLSTIEETQQLCSTHSPPKRLLWIVGPAGVGKSAIMQTVAETLPNMGAAVFFSVNGRNDSTKVMNTLAFQLAIKFSRYSDYIRSRAAKDPSIFSKSMPAQFYEFITEPFANRRIYCGTESLVIFIDGVDECDSIPAQRELLQLISGFIADHPSIPLLWITAGRPEPHLTTFFDSLDVEIYKKTELLVNSDQSCADVEKYLRDSFAKIRSNYPHLQSRPQWPIERELIRIIAAARGLFAYGNTAVRFVDDAEFGDPQSQFNLLLNVIDDSLMRGSDGGLDEDPLALLYALYDRIISRVPKRTYPDTERLLYFTGILPGHGNDGYTLAWAAEWLRMSPGTAYARLHHLHSVLRIPPTREDAVKGKVEAHHKSFKDYLSKKFPADKEKDQQIKLDAAMAIFKEVSQESVIDFQPWNCLELYWPHAHTNITGTKRKLYFGASQVVEMSKLAPGQIIARNPDIIHAMQIMSSDYHNTSGQNWNLSNWLTVCAYLFLPERLNIAHFSELNIQEDEAVVHVLKKLRVFRSVTVGSLILDHIWSSQQNFYISYKSKDPTQVSPRIQAQIPCVSVRYFEFPSTSQVANFILYASTSGKPKLKKGNKYITSRFISTYASGSPRDSHRRCRHQLEHDLNTVHASAPDTLVTIWTGGDGLGLVIYDFIDPDNAEIEWQYIMPYKSVLFDK